MTHRPGDLHLGAGDLEEEAKHVSHIGIVLDEQDLDAVEPGRSGSGRLGDDNRFELSPFLTRKKGKPYREGRSLPDARAVGVNATAMPFDKRLHDGEPETDPALPRARHLRLAEPLEEMRQELRGDALTGIGDLKLHLRTARGEPNLDAPPWRRELHGVRHKVLDDLRQTKRVTCDRREDAVIDDDHVDGLGVSRQAKRIQCLLNHRAEVDGLTVETYGATDDPGNVE